MANSDSQPFRYLIAGPCAAESEAQVYETARQLFLRQKELPCPLTYFRAGVWKPRSNADDFCGAGEKAFPWLLTVREDFGFDICVEVANARHVDLCRKYGIRNVWIGARTSVNPFIVQEIAQSIENDGFTIMIKNPAIPDLKLWEGNIERFEKAGAKQILAIHRGFAQQQENVLRNSPMWEIPTELRIARPDLPILCDPSHICGNKQYIKQIAQIAIDYGCNGLMIETHENPTKALSDAQQQITPEELSSMLNSLIFKHLSKNPDDLLRQQRTLIRNIDAQISQLLSKRMKVVEEIARIKNEHNIPLVQPGQWNTVVQNYKQQSSQDTCYQEFIDNYLNILHQYSLKKQEKS